MKAKSNNQKLVEEIITREGLSEQVESNRQTFILLIHDQKFQELVGNIRKKHNIPLKRGFRPKTKKLKEWAENLEDEIWYESLMSVLDAFPHLNENFLQHISIYIKFNSIYYGPILNHKIGLAELNGVKRDWLTITIYEPPDGNMWKRIRNDANKFFQTLGTEQKKPIANFDLKLKALEKNPNLITGVVDEKGQVVKDEVLADRLVNITGDIDKEKNSIDLIRQYRKRMLAEKKKRLG